MSPDLEQLLSEALRLLTHYRTRAHGPYDPEIFGAGHDGYLRVFGVEEAIAGQAADLIRRAKEWGLIRSEWSW